MKRQMIETEERERRERQRIERAERAKVRDQAWLIDVTSTSRRRLSSVRQNAHTNTDDGEDIISSLPDSLLCHIPSFLPIRDSVATNILSNEFNAIVLVATLKRLHLHWNVQPSSKYIFQINTPALEYFHFRGYLNRDDALEKLPNVVECVIQIEDCEKSDDYAKRVWDFMGKLYNVISMELSIITALILFHDSNHEDIPTFHNLSSLKFCGDIWFDWFLVKERKGFDAQVVLNQMKVYGIKSDIVCYTMVLKGDFGKADGVFDELLVFGLVPDVCTYNVCVYGL
ncbi:hypothetical protein CMV_011733 [Castanea mollissima]|uniref:Uncharacterized protein n=1 Tax=Castanea mollissima TaxID=60419 RepID=A0A8J4VKH7_9ROSI|nr:hypothetical protein CMV_011733 [Castanea mollissima]